ncbi:hypothetical protein LP422_01245 [Janibacter limosus]|uniref:hypothetical protein n=1 Tax=Janibacter limosus TaxID=53458 RepID=UPI0035D973F1|nr:hypothetical protein LP422_01245 [Janibacter limosus]
MRQDHPGRLRPARRPGDEGGARQQALPRSLHPDEGGGASRSPLARLFGRG